MWRHRPIADLRRDIHGRDESIQAAGARRPGVERSNMKQDSCSCGKCSHKQCTNRVPIFSGLNDEELSYVADLIKRRQYLKGEIIQLEGSELDCLTIINQGKVKAFRMIKT